MANISTEQVKQLVDSVPPEVTDLSPFIDASYLLVQDVLQNKGMSQERLDQIELWLAAHFTAISYMTPAEERADVVSQSFQYKLGLHFEVTMFGQQALMLDTSGTLLALQEGRVPFRFKWLGNKSHWSHAVDRRQE